MMSLCAALLVLAAVCFRDASGLSTGAPPAACTTLTQQHFTTVPRECTESTGCPFNVSLVEIDGAPVTTDMYRCGSQHTLRVETNDSAVTFRGFAVQVREATGGDSFDNGAAFVGAFVNPPVGGDWRIWDCSAPSATHPNNNDKTSVDLTWQAPGDPSTTDVTIWFAITRVFTIVHAQLRGPTLRPDPAFCAPPPPAPLELNFINDSPSVSGSTITADIQFSRPVESLQCRLTGIPYQDCSNGTVTFENVPPRDENNRVYILRVIGNTADGVRTVIRRRVRPEEDEFCLVHFINDAVTVDGTNATIEFTGLGSFETFLCDLDREGLQPCASPQVYTGLSSGDHRVKVVPNIEECGSNRRPQVINFTV